MYARVKKIAPVVDSLNIGGCFPIKNSLQFDYDYEYMANEIVYQIKKFCEEEGVEEEGEEGEEEKGKEEEKEKERARRRG